jgi:hypothetical protein
MTLTIEYVDWTTLRPHWDNPRLGDTDAIAESVTANGVYRPMVVAQDGTILTGNHLYEVLGDRGGGQVPVVRLPIEPDSAAARRILLVDNRTADRGRYDEGRLLDSLKALDENDSLWGSGYEGDDLADLEANLARLSHIPLSPQPAKPREVQDRPGATPPPPRDPVRARDDSRPPLVERRYLALPFSPEDHQKITEVLTAHRDLYGLPDLSAALHSILQEAGLI